MKCEKCGTEFIEGIFCPECGTRFESESENIKKYVDREHVRKVQESKVKELQEQKRILEEQKTKERIEQAKLEQERIAKERVEKETELIRLKNENLRIEQELADKRKKEEQNKAEELSRTFNGKVYANVEEMNVAKEERKANMNSIICLVLAIATFPLTLTIVLWIPSIIVSFVLGINALKAGSKLKGLAIAGLIINAIFIGIIIVSIVLTLCA